MEKKTLVDFGDVRIRENNELNHVVERYVKSKIPKTDEIKESWKFIAYCTSVKSGLKIIKKNELLLDLDKIKDLDSYLEQVEKSNDKIQQKIKEI